MVLVTPRPVHLSVLLAVATILAACGGVPTGRGDALSGWRPIEARAEDRSEYVRGSAIIHILEPRPVTGDVFAAAFLDDEATLQRLIAVSGSNDVTAIARSPLRVNGAVHWIDITFTLDGVARRTRIVWFDSEDGLRVFRLVAAVTEWETRDISALMNHVALSARELAPEYTEAPPEPED
jgi:hypothetical protein